MNDFLIELIKQISCEICTVIIIELLKEHQAKSCQDKSIEELAVNEDEINEVYESIRKIRLKIGISDEEFEKAYRNYLLGGES